MNRKESPIADSEIEGRLANKKLNFIAALDKQQVYLNAEPVIIATPTDYDTETAQEKKHLPLFTETSVYEPSSPCFASKADSDYLVRAWQRTLVYLH